ncbi:MAG: hypothetical protein ACRDCW_01560 [Sarcina sp.]
MDKFDERDEFQEAITEIREQNRYGNDEGHYVGKIKPQRGLQNLYRKPSFLFCFGGILLLSPILNIINNGFIFLNLIGNLIATILGVICIIAGFLRIKK